MPQAIKKTIRGLPLLVLVALLVSCGESEEVQYGNVSLQSKDVTKLCSPTFKMCYKQDSESKPPYASYLKWIVPSDSLPDDVIVQPANNNLDIVEHRCKLFLAFRTAPYHYASFRTKLYILSTEDEENWTYEFSYNMNTDLREPRFLSYGNRLFLYFAVLGDNPLDFEPQGMMVTEYQGSGKWAKPEWVYKPGFIPWRAKVENGIPYLLGYIGGENIYNEGETAAINVYWLTTKDGKNFEPIVPDQPVVLSGGVSETDLTILDDSTLVAVSRNEGGDEEGFGSKICKTNDRYFGNWECKSDPKKYDSPLVFKHNNKAYLIARRNVTETGNYDLGMDDLSQADQKTKYEIDYWNTPKRCSLWEIDEKELKVNFILDLPSAGDTCFAGLTKICANQYLVYNYTSPLEKPDISWSDGQTGRTYIYRAILFMP